MAHEVGIDGQRLAILNDRFVEPSHLQQQFGVGIVGIGIVRNQFDVFLEGLLGVGVVTLLPVGIAENVIGRANSLEPVP